MFVWDTIQWMATIPTNYLPMENTSPRNGTTLYNKYLQKK